MRLKKFISSILLALCPLLAFAQEVLGVDNTLPARYEKRNGRLQIHSYVLLSEPAGRKTKLTLDGAPLVYEGTSRSDSILVWMPMIGKESRLEVLNGKQLMYSRIVQAPIDSDWGYFQQGEIHLIQSSHQDIAWMNTPEYCRTERIRDIILPALKMMDEDPDFTFEMEQTLNLIELLEVHPERKDEVIKRYEERRFFWGATYNQPYEGLASGEQLVRQTYFGRKWIKDNLPGCDDVTAVNVDVPGRAIQMPQILAKSGVRNLFISRFKEGLYDWSSPDGSFVQCYSPGNYGWATIFWRFFDEDVLTAFRKLHTRLALWDIYYKGHNLPPMYAVIMSCDATKPRSFSAIIKEWNTIADMAEVPLPRVKYSNMDTFLDAVNTPDARREQVEGERPGLWLYIHGPAHYDQTLDKRRAGIVLPAAEFFSALNYVNGSKQYPAASLDRGWMASIYPDHGLGGKNGEITDRIFGDSLAVARRIGEKVLDDQLSAIAEGVAGKKGDFVLFNDLTWRRISPVCVPSDNTPVIVKDSKGVIVAHQAEGDSVRFLAEVPSMGYALYSVTPVRTKTRVKASALTPRNHYENQYYDIVFGDGGIVRLYDKELGKEIIENEKYVLGDIYDCEYTGNGAGEFTRITDITPDSGKSLNQYKARWNLVTAGPVCAIFENEVETPHATVIQRITIYEQIKKIDFDVTLRDFDGAHNRQYRIMFPLKMKQNDCDVRYEVPMAISQVGVSELDRKPMGWAWNGSYVFNPADSHPREILNFITASGNGFGFTMSSCVAVCDWIDPAREIADYPILQGILLSSHKSCHGEGNWYHQTGTHHFHFSISTHPEGWKEGYARAIEENHPFYVTVKGSDGGFALPSDSFMSLSDPLVWVSAMKKADVDDSVILRLVEMEGCDKDVSITLPFAVDKVILCDMIEDEIKLLDGEGRSIQFHLGHNAIETYKLIVKK